MTTRKTIPAANVAEAETAMREVVQRLAENLFSVSIMTPPLVSALGVVETTLRHLAADAGVPLRVLAGRVAVFLSHRARG